MKKFLGYIFSALMLAACASELDNEMASEDCGILVNAQCADTKSTLSPDFDVVWSKEDRITVLSLDGETVAVSEPAGADADACDFKVSSWPEDKEPRYAVFNGMLDEASASIEGRYIRTSIKTAQLISDEASFGRDANLSVGELKLSQNGEWQTEMKNVCALVGFSLDRFEAVKSVTVFNRAGGKSLSGTVDIFMEDGVPVIKDVVEGKTYVAASMADGKSFFEKGKTYYICVRPEVEFIPSFVFLLEDGTRYKYEGDKSVYIRRSTIMDFGNVDTEAVEAWLDPVVSNENFVDGGSVEMELWENKLAEGYHPRLILDKNDFTRLKGMVGGTEVVGKLHDHIMRVADETVADTKTLAFALDASGKRILDVSRDALARLSSCAYAYRMTGQTKYLDKAIRDLGDVCDFSSWNPSHYLDVAEMATAVSIAYDWLYDSLSSSLKIKVVNALKDYALQTSRNSSYTWWYSRIGNWNQVCNGGLVCAAVAIYENCPELAQAVIDDAIRTNRTAVEGIYAPDGAYPEGPTYWGYGTIYQVLMLAILEDVFGTDYGLSSAQGFMETGMFKIFSRGSMGMQFNFADNGVSNNSNYALYYFASKRNEPSMLFNEVENLLDRKGSDGIYTYTGSEQKGLIPLCLKYAMDMDLTGLTGPTQKFYAAQGNTPVMMCRSGWEHADHYLGIKGGQDGYLHGHMDGGSFVYYADGVRWAMDYVRQSYTDVENGIAALGGRLADYTQNSLRWRLFRLNCRQHNTLTVNDKDHNVKGFVSMIATENTSSRMAATFDLAPLFDGDLVTAERTAAICNEEYIEIKDVLEAPDGKPAHVRWTMVSKAKPEITSSGIRLSRNGMTRVLKTEGPEVTYRIWSSDPQEYDSPLKHLDVYDADSYICGYEIDIPAGTKYTLVTTLKK